MAATLGWSIFLRSLLVQSSWNVSGLQSLGFFFMTAPAAAQRRLPAPEAARVGLRRLHTFNTHPYFAGLVAAIVLREEERGGDDETIDGLKHSLACTLGAVGDEFFWATLRPLAAVVALSASLASVVWAPLIMLAVYNVPHVAVRVWGVGAGLSRGKSVVETLKRRPLSRVLPLLGGATTMITGFLVGAGTLDRSWGLLPGRGLVSVVAALAAFLALLALQSRGFGQGRLLACASALAAVAGVVRVVSTP